MSEFQKVTSAEELQYLDDDDMVAGYFAGLGDAGEPGSQYSRSYWHGWRNGRMDGGFAPADAEQALLAHSMHVSNCWH